jgi:GNAT superfamily N-acetyltransferase
MRVALLREESGNPIFAGPDPRALSRARRLTRDQLARSDQVMLVAARGGRLVGLLRCSERRSASLVRDRQYGLVSAAYVARSHRRNGVLRALLGAADAWCRARGLAGMRLRCSLGNTTGRRAWQALGFTPAELLLVRAVPGA